MKKLIDFTEVSVKKIEEIMGAEGHRTFSGAVLAIVASYYNKAYFTKYKGGVARDIEPEMSPEQKCELYGGKVMLVRNERQCVIRGAGDSARAIPLDKVDAWKK